MATGKTRTALKGSVYNPLKPSFNPMWCQNTLRYFIQLATITSSDSHPPISLKGNRTAVLSCTCYMQL